MPEPATTSALDYWNAKRQGLRLPEHELRCEACGEPSEAAICLECTEATLQSEIHQ